MKKTLIMLICVLSMISLLLISCDGGKKQNDTCEHTFSDKWYSDANNHWHPATCEHAETEKGDFGPHVDADEDGICDVCELEIGHTHTFAADWSINDTHHWKDATCSHDEKDKLSTHSDEDMNGDCDVCGGHVHNVNPAGYCTHAGCGEKVKDIDETSLDQLVNAILFQKYLVNGGELVYAFNGPSNTGPDFVASKTENVSYIFGKDGYVNVSVSTDSINAGNQASGTYETWHQPVNAETLFGVVSNNGGALELDMAEPARINGYYVSLSSLVGEYGIEETLYILYTIAIGDFEEEEDVTATTGNLVITPNTDENKVTFKYSYTTAVLNTTDVTTIDPETNASGRDTVYNVNLFEVEVTFSYSDDYALTALEIKVDRYTNDPGTADGIGFLYHDVDLEYDPETGDITFVKYDANTKEYYPTDERTPDTYRINVTQTLGDRDAENPYPKSKFVPTGFDLYLNRDESTGTLSNQYDGSLMKCGVRDIINLYVGTCTPEGTSIHFAADAVSFKLFLDGVEVQNPADYTNETAVVMFTFAGSQRSFFFIPKAEGAYELEIYILDKLLYDITVHVGPVDEQYIELGDNEFAVKVTEAYSWTNEVTFTAPEAGTYYFNLPAGVGFIDADAYDEAAETEATDDGPTPFFDYNVHGNENGGSFHLTLEEGESIRFYVNATQRQTYVISFYTI